MTRPDDATAPDGPDSAVPGAVPGSVDTGSAPTTGSTALLVESNGDLDPDVVSSPDAPEPAREREWAWVTRWRQENEPTPWGPGLVLALFTAVLVAVAIVVLTQGLGDLPLLAVLINIVVAAGLAPAIWMVRAIPVIRWIGAGMAVGLVVGWCAAAAVVTAF